MTSMEKLKAIYEMNVNVSLDLFGKESVDAFVGDNDEGNYAAESFSELDQAIDWLHSTVMRKFENVK